MCGIYGSSIYYDDALVAAKLKRVEFRGPDFSGFERNDGVVLGHNRLAIIDLDPRSNQPYTYRHLKIVFNGEIYNYIAIRNTLIGLGYAFATSSDTEVICAAYLAYGEQCVVHFNGMFAFVIHDLQGKKLFGARDRLGKKPFYYHHHNGFEFASQPSQIKLGKNMQVDQAAIEAYLFWNYIPDSLCIYRDIHKLNAGHSFSYHLPSGTLEVKKYWDIKYDWASKFTGTYSEAKSYLYELIEDSLKIRLNADVPLGIFLSGGIDSSLITSMACKQQSNVKTFCISFEEKGLDESAYAQKVAQYLETDHHTISCNYQDGLKLIENYSHYYDEPFADPSAIPLMLLAKYTKEHVTVALSGDGGDEGFLGYNRYGWMKKAQWIYRFPLVLRKALSWFMNLSPNYKHRLIANGLIETDIAKLYIRLCTGMDSSWLLDPRPEESQQHNFILDLNHKPLLERISDYDIKTYLNEDINTKVDRATMSFMLEARAPLMDYRIIEFANSLPTKFKIDSLHGKKRILKDLLFDHVPSSLFNRPKAGFTLPIKSWLRTELKEYVLDILTPSNLKNIPGINPVKVKYMIDEHLANRNNFSSQIWSMLILSNWLNHAK
ncbi:asparagine synthase (glutamine-hydrolyzing) [Pedobacter sp. ASV28]|uniref:asparagine synthase (glutamine-hydrolyzing) n=1 Tax=Pedobacter sp. ASV28 TaxID=2795123 RepID=UPI0018EAD994|nr:asparagine synthase (glutamine-hydrolyzing) [Pedobacter sp. ASV28]